jgi:nitrate reductase delta subunit
MLAPSRKSADRHQAASRVKAWARERFSLGAEATILVTEIESAQPGFPPLATVVAFWTAERRHYHWRIFKPIQEVVQDDLPPAWYRQALEVTGGMQCSCC